MRHLVFDLQVWHMQVGISAKDQTVNSLLEITGRTTVSLLLSIWSMIWPFYMLLYSKTPRQSILPGPSPRRLDCLLMMQECVSTIEIFRRTDIWWKLSRDTHTQVRYLNVPWQIVSQAAADFYWSGSTSGKRRIDIHHGRHRHKALVGLANAMQRNGLQAKLTVNGLFSSMHLKIDLLSGMVVINLLPSIVWLMPQRLVVLPLMH